MNSYSGEQVLHHGLLTKRAIGKGKIKHSNWKKRYFILTSTSLSYYADKEKGDFKNVPSAESFNQDKLDFKDNIPIESIKAIEQLDFSAFDKSNGIQIHFNKLVLYALADNEQDQRDWIESIRDVCEKNTCLVHMYHPGFYKGSWTCCKDVKKDKGGCKNTFIKDLEHRNQAQSSHDAMRVVARYDYEPRQTGDLELKKGEEYIVLRESEPNWWYAQDSGGKMGYIPANFVDPVESLESQKWYYADMTRQQAETALNDPEQPDGTFLVRISSRPNTQPYTLSMKFQGAIRHYHVNKDEMNQYWVSDRHKFDTVEKMITYHKCNSAGLVCRLRNEYIEGEEPPLTLGYVGFEINRKQIEKRKQLGVGQFGSVFEGLYQKKTPIAIKQMKEGTMSEQDFIEEAKVMQKFQHKHLVSLLGICSQPPGPLLLVMELLAHGALLEYLRKHRDSLWGQSDKLTDMALQVCSAMQYLEQMGFIHRDLAARNCLVGEKMLVKVGDFGLARYVLDDQYTASEGTKFPVKWASPEVIDYTNFSSKSDVWAFGVLTWEIFTCGASPYERKSTQQVAELVRRGQHLSRPDNTPDPIFDIMKQCWQQRPESRPPFRMLYKLLSTFSEELCEGYPTETFDNRRPPRPPRSNGY